MLDIQSINEMYANGVINELEWHTMRKEWFGQKREAIVRPRPEPEVFATQPKHRRGGWKVVFVAVRWIVLAISLASVFMTFLYSKD